MAMSPARLKAGLWICALLCLQAQPTLAAEPERPPVLTLDTTAPVPLTFNESSPDMALPYGAGYELRKRLAESKTNAASRATSSASQGSEASRGGSGSGSSGGTGGSGNGNGGRRR